MFYTNAPEGHIWSKEFVSKYFPGLRKVLREDLFQNGSHLNQTEIYTPVDFSGLGADENPDYFSFDDEIANIWLDEGHFRTIQEDMGVRSDGTSIMNKDAKRKVLNQ